MLVQWSGGLTSACNTLPMMAASWSWRGERSLLASLPLLPLPVCVLFLHALAHWRHARHMQQHRRRCGCRCTMLHVLTVAHWLCLVEVQIAQV